jgi:AcrR family transcriptional regulator
MKTAVALFVEFGANGVTMEAVAARAGVGKTTIYRHWHTRDLLLSDVFRQFDHAFTTPHDGLTAIDILRLQARELAATLATPAWQQALPALLDVARRSDEFADLHLSPVTRGGSMSLAIRRGMEEGLFPGAHDAGELLAQIVGPLTVAAIFAPETLTDAFATDLVTRLVRGYGGRLS